MDRINALHKFFIKNKLYKEAKFILKISTPLDADYLIPDDRKDVLLKTKNIIPNIYISKNIFSADSLNRLLDEISSKPSSGARRLDNRRKFKAKYVNFTNIFIYMVHSTKDAKKYEDRFGTITVALTKENLFKALENAHDKVLSSSNSSLAKRSNDIYTKIYSDIKNTISSYSGNYDLYFIPAMLAGDADFNHTKEYIYHDFLGHGFESLFSEFRKLIKNYMVDVLNDVFEESYSYNVRLSNILNVFFDVIGKDNFNSLFGQQVAAGILDDPGQDAFYDLFSSLLEDEITIKNINLIGKKYSRLGDTFDSPPKKIIISEKEQSIFSDLSYVLEFELNKIKNKLIESLNSELKSLGDKKYIVQYIKNDLIGTGDSYNPLEKLL